MDFSNIDIGSNLYQLGLMFVIVGAVAFFIHEGMELNSVLLILGAIISGIVSILGVFAHKPKLIKKKE